MMNSDAKDFLIFVKGYHQLFCGSSDLIKYQSGGRPMSNHASSGTIHIQDGLMNDLEKVSAFGSQQRFQPCGESFGAWGYLALN